MHDQAKGRAKKNEAKKPKTVKAFVAMPICLSNGQIYEVKGTLSASGDVLEVPSPFDAHGRLKAFFKPDWHAKRADAVARCCELRDDKIDELEAKIAELKSLKF